MSQIFSRNCLTIEQVEDGRFVCKDLQNLAARFSAKWTPEDVRVAVDQQLLVIRGQAEMRYETEEEHKAVEEAERRRLGAELFDQFIAKFRSSVGSFDNMLSEFLFWMSDWWYYNPELTQTVRSVDRGAIHSSANELACNHVLPVLPEPISRVISDGHFSFRAVAVRFGHFAFLFGNKKDEPEDRLIVTDTQLFRINKVGGYVYLDLLPNGMPLARCCTERGGERAFFDGTRLMAHDRFQTCAPKPGFFPGGYTVNSTRCTIINGRLFPLIASDDKVAQTTGAWMGLVDWNLSQFMACWQMADDTAGRLTIDGGQILHDGKKLNPVGVFQPSKMTLTESGFVQVDWSEFVETKVILCKHIAVVDDKADWLAQVKDEFAQEVDTFDSLQTTDKVAALMWIREKNPEVLLLDVHLTPLQEFDGLWIANQLAQGGFTGRILLCSSYKEETLSAMRVLVRHERTEAPGKDLVKVRACLSRF